jgi:predicted solute-binding protein
MQETLVRVASVDARVCVARTFRKRESYGLTSILNQTSVHETLQSNETRLQQELDPKNSYVKIGDEALQYEGEFTGLVYDF